MSRGAPWMPQGFNPVSLVVKAGEVTMHEFPYDIHMFGSGIDYKGMNTHTNMLACFMGLISSNDLSLDLNIYYLIVYYIFKHEMHFSIIFLNIELNCTALFVCHRAGIHIQASDDISVQAASTNDLSTDAYTALPMTSLGTHYYVITYIYTQESVFNQGPCTIGNNCRLL